ncbi:MAG TPA: hypothetical protein VFQ39_15680 [Longimicrobium sp.]|nr:hypothetical protein [Longimicrobium sp.]
MARAEIVLFRVAFPGRALRFIPRPSMFNANLCPNPGCRREVPPDATRCVACGAVIVRHGAASAAAPAASSPSGTRWTPGYTLYRLARIGALLAIVVAAGVGFVAMRRAEWKVREVDGMRIEAPAKFRPTSDVPLQVRDDTFATTQYRAKLRRGMAGVTHVQADPREVRAIMDTASRMMAAILARRPNVKVTCSEIRTVRFEGANARRTVMRYTVKGRAHRTDALLLRQGNEFWIVEIAGPETSDNEARALRILGSVQLPPRRR